MKNKKLALSVLSTAVVSSIASSAYAAPDFGIYVGGNVDKYYTITSFINTEDAIDDVVDAGFDNVVYVHEDGRATTVTEAISAGNLISALRPATKDDFEDSYLNVETGGTEDPKSKVDGDAGELMVESVSAINAKTIEIKFSKAVDPDSVIGAVGSDDTLEDGVFEFSKIGSAPAVIADNANATLSADGKTLTITAAAGEYFNGKYAVTVTDAVVDAEGNPIEAYSAVHDFTDSTRPTVSEPTYPANGVATFKFSEPLNVANAAAVEAALSIKDANGASVSVTGLVTSLSADNTSFDLDISGFTTGEEYTVTIVGLKDYAGNLITPNPTTLTVVNDTVDNVDPAVVGIVVKDDDEFTIQFSEELQAAPTVTIDGTDVTVGGGTVTVDSVDKTKYNVQLGAPESGIVTVGVAAGYQDKSGNSGQAWSKLVEFKADTTSPNFVSSELKAIGGTQYLILNFDEEVTVVAGSNITGTYVDENQVTKSATIVAANVTLYDPDGDGAGTAVKVDLTGQETGEYNVTVPNDLIQDAAGNFVAATNVSFTLGTLNDSVKPTVFDADGDPSNGYDGITVQATEDKVTVVFSENVTAATALDESNYLVEGQEVFEKAIFDGDQKTVTLTLKPDVITVTGDREFTISGVADASGNVMDTVTTQVQFVENVKPVITSAQLTAADEITLTFSEDLVAASVTDNDDFEVYIDGEKATIDSAAIGGAANEVVLTLNAATVVTDLNDPVVVKVLSGNNVVDTATPGNSLATTGEVTVEK
ncbi:MAG: Ig-like domain-containing protein [Brevibacillus sp.]|nr:Ig-like domain-containing protein [Brevibacillus sp.]